MYSKWMLYMSTKYFHNLIDENPTVNQATLNYPHDVISYVSRYQIKPTPKAFAGLKALEKLTFLNLHLTDYENKLTRQVNYQRNICN